MDHTLAMSLPTLWASLVQLFAGKNTHIPGMPLLSAACVHDSAEQAKETMEKLIEQLKADFA